jgi:hypothetical protein
VVLDAGSGRYEHFDVNGGWKVKYEFTEVIQRKDGPLLIIKEWPLGENWETGAPTVDTLVFRFGCLIEYNAHPEGGRIEEIVLKSEGELAGIGTELRIDSRGWTTYERREHPTRIFAGEIDKGSFDRLVQSINYLNLPLMSDNFPIGYANMPIPSEIFELTVTFDDERIKKIRDRGAAGSHGLVNLYRQLIKISESLSELY